MDISVKVKEAETYRSMGLLEESILIYEEILISKKILKNNIRNQLKSTIADIRLEIESLENCDANTISEEAIAIIRDTLAISDEVRHIIDSASAFMELGLYREALAEYAKVLGDESTRKDVIQNLATCLLKCSFPSEILSTVDKMVARTETNDKEKSEIKFRLGLEMQKRDHKVFAKELYRSAKTLDPDNEEINKWLDLNNFLQKFSSKYDHLMSQKKITPGQLKKHSHCLRKPERASNLFLFTILRLPKWTWANHFHCFTVAHSDSTMRAYSPHLNWLFI